MAAKITWGGHEVHNPFMRFVCAAIVMFGVLVILPIGIAISFPVHLLLRLFGRRGFVTTDADGKITYDANADGFKRRKPR